MNRLSSTLNREPSINYSGKILNYGIIPVLKEKHYFIKNQALDGDAPKQFIKAYFFEKDSSIRKNNLDSWPSFIAKTAAKWYPHESVVEYMINRIGQTLGLNMNKVALVIANGQIRFLSRYFLKKDERLIHGAEICGGYLDDSDFAKEIAENKEKARELFTFEFIRNAINAVYPNCCHMLIIDMVKMIVFDAIVGNNDRHFYNWGIIDSSRKSQKNPIFAPVFDSSRGLLWNTSDENVIKHLTNHKKSGKKVVNYIERAYPRISIEGNNEANHFDLVNFLVKENVDYHNVIKDMVSKNNEFEVLKMLKKEFNPLYIKERSELITVIIQMRFQKIREVCYV